jgi:tetratricopeptide (TPR) repeat protein
MREFIIAWTIIVFLTMPSVAFQSASPQELYREGLAAYNEGDYERAVEQLRLAAALSPDIPDYRFSLGLAYLKAGQAKKAASELEAVRGMIGLRLQTRVKEPLVLLHIASAYIQLDKLDSAKKRLEMALERDSELVEAHYSLGLIAQREGRHADAVRHFELLLEHNPDHPDANLAMANWLREEGREEEALERLRRASQGSPYDFSIQMIFGTVAFEMGVLEDAEEAFRRASELRPESRDARFNLATVMLAKRQYPDAIQLLEHLAQGDSPHDGAAYNLAQAYRGAGRTEDAVGVLAELLGRAPDYPQANFSMGLLQEALGDPDGAEKFYRMEIEVQPQFLSSYLNLAVLLEQRKKPGEAVEVLRKALALEIEEDQAAQIREAIQALEGKSGTPKSEIKNSL